MRVSSVSTSGLHKGNQIKAMEDQMKYSTCGDLILNTSIRMIKQY